MARLRSYPQIKIDLEGFVADAETGQGIGGALVEVKCPLKTFKGRSGKYGSATFSKFLIKRGISGPNGYRCYARFSKPGYIPLRYDVVIQRTETQALFRTGMLLPKKKFPFRVVLQYGDSPADIDAHLFIQKASPVTKKPVNIGEHYEGSTKFSYDTSGSKDAYPFATMDSKCNKGYGPETHTIHKIQATKYGYYVTNFDHHISSNEAFHASGARVFLYQGDKLTHSFAIRNAQGALSRWWQVFTIDCTLKPPAGTKGPVCKVVPIGTFVKEQPDEPLLGDAYEGVAGYKHLGTEGLTTSVDRK